MGRTLALSAGAVLLASRVSAERRYEENAWRAWGCRPDDPECPRKQ